MTLLASVGRSSARRSVAAGREAATDAMTQLGDRQASVVLVFATAEYKQEKLISAIGEVFGDTPMIGCSGEGIITQAGSDESAYAVAVMAIAGDRTRFHTFMVEGFSHGADVAAAQLAAQMKASGHSDGKVLLLFPDGLTGNTTELVASLRSKLPLPVRFVGGTAGDMMKLEKTYQYCDGRVQSDGVAALLIDGDVRIEMELSHGCVPLGAEMRITKAEGGMIYEIDNRRAWDVFREYLNGDPQDLSAADVVHLCVGQKLAGEKGGYVVRTPLQLDQETGGLFFPGGLDPEVPIQMTRRDPARIRESAMNSSKELLSRVSDRKPAAVLQFDCAGRGRVIFGNRTTEKAITPMQEIVGKDVPWIGFHTFGEIGPLGDRSHYHNFTVVLCMLFEE